MGSFDIKGMPPSIDDKDKHTSTYPCEVICITFMKWPHSIIYTSEGHEKHILSTCGTKGLSLIMVNIVEKKKGNKQGY